MDTSPRIPRHRYVDPLDQIWLTCVARLGFGVERDGEVYASSDGRGTLRIGTAGSLDPDDCLAQILYHEMCHALVEGPEKQGQPDWGLDNITGRDDWRELACLRLQAALAAPYGLRWFLAPTTDFRTFYDALPADPLEPADDPTTIAAKQGLVRAQTSPWADALRDALSATAIVARAVQSSGTLPVGSPRAHPVGSPRAHPFQSPLPPAGEGQGEGTSEPLLYTTLEPPAGTHPAGYFLPRPGTPAAAQRCGTCTWRFDARGTLRCRQADGARIAEDLPACERWEGELDCQACGACCREAYGAVAITRRDPFLQSHPELVTVRPSGGDAVPLTALKNGRIPAGAWLEVQRSGERCAALSGGHDRGEPYACQVYDARPRCCRDLARGGEHCLWARRRVGLSR